jgi:hypothetical protein
MMLAFRQNMNFKQQFNLYAIEPASYFSNICIKNLEFVQNQTEELQVSSLFTPKYKEHHLLALAMSLYYDVIRKNENFNFK